ncbi:GNAT family N-acetyltransferase [uncultured Massilia sp.]|uniref:GNAT family N-acetyltransferase n=1 Tax=uncultured Massilia sp. TaxID=169973 RepID=UPI0025CD28B3|nr:GNAT family N-acetyltransferase [uncultured Massilia sp.]
MKWTLLPAAGFMAHAARWDALRATGPSAPVLDSYVVGALLDAFGAGAELLALCEDAAGPAAAAVLAPQGAGRWATFQPSQAPVGPWLQRPGLDTDALLAGLVRALPGCALLAGLTQCDPFLLPRPAGPRASTDDYIDTARISVAGDFDSWWNGRGKNLRANLRKQRNRLAGAGIAPRLEVWRAPERMAQAVADYGRLESTGWKGRAGTAVAADNAQGRFYRALLEASCALGRGSVYRYWFGEELVAMDLCIEEGDCIVVLKTAYDERVPAHYSPALLMREEACRRLFDEGRVRRIEFYGKVMEWHTRWTDEIRTMYHLNHYRWQALGRLHAWRRRAA